MSLILSLRLFYMLVYYEDGEVFPLHILPWIYVFQYINYIAKHSILLPACNFTYFQAMISDTSFFKILQKYHNLSSNSEWFRAFCENQWKVNDLWCCSTCPKGNTPIESQIENAKRSVTSNITIQRNAKIRDCLWYHIMLQNLVQNILSPNCRSINELRKKLITDTTLCPSASVPPLCSCFPPLSPYMSPW